MLNPWLRRNVRGGRMHSALLLCVFAGCEANPPTAVHSQASPWAVEPRVTHFMLTPDGSSLIVRSSSGIVQLVNVASHVETARVPYVGPVCAVGMTSDGRHLVGSQSESPGKGFASEDRIEVRSVPSGETIATVKNAQTLAFTPDGNHVIIDIGAGRFARRRISDLTDKLEFRAGDIKYLKKTKFFSPRPNDTTLIVADEVGYVHLVDWKMGKPVQQRVLLLPFPSTCAVHRAGTLIAAGSGVARDDQRHAFHGIKVWDFEHQREAQSWTVPDASGVVALAFLDETRVVSSDQQANVDLWTSGRRAPRRLYTHSAGIVSLLTLPGKDCLVFLDRNGSLYELPVPEAAQSANDAGVQETAASPDHPSQPPPLALDEVSRRREEFFEDSLGELPQNRIRAENFPTCELFAMQTNLPDECWVYVTSGLTNRNMNVRTGRKTGLLSNDHFRELVARKNPALGTPGYGFELILLTRQKEAWPLESLQRDLADKSLNALTTNLVNRNSAVIWARADSGLNFLVTRAQSPLPESCDLPNGRLVLLVMVSITDAERDFGLKHGFRELYDKLRQLPNWQISQRDRASVVGSAAPSTPPPRPRTPALRS